MPHLLNVTNKLIHALTVFIAILKAATIGNNLINRDFVSDWNFVPPRKFV
jgi:hypothetical protein